MHGCSSTPFILVNAEVDSMGGFVEGGVGVANKTSPRRAAIEKVQAELRQEYDVREKRKRELEFLEKGGNPLDFKLGNAASVSVQSTSFTDQHPDQLVNCEAKGSFAFTASPHGDSVESSGRLGANPCEPNSADNLMLFDAEHEFSEGGRNPLHPSRSNIVPSEKLSQMDGSNRTWQHGDSAVPRKAYKRRYRSRPNRYGTGSSSTDVNPNHGSHGSSIPSRHGPVEVQRLISDAENQSISPNCNSKPSNLTGDAPDKTGLMDSQQDMELDGVKAVESTKDHIEGISVDAASDAVASETPLDDQHIQQLHSGFVKASDAPEAVQVMEEMSSAVIESQPSATAKVENQSISRQLDGLSSKKGDGMKNDAYNSSASRGIKGFDSESSCTQTSRSVDGNNDGEMCTKMRNADSNGEIKDEMLGPDRTLLLEGDDFVKESKETEGVDSSTLIHVESTSAFQSEEENVLKSQPEEEFKSQPEEELTQGGSAMKNGVDPIVLEGMAACGPAESESERKPAGTLGDNPGPHREKSCNGGHQDSIKISVSDHPVGGYLARVSNDSFEAHTCSVPDSVLASKIDEDSILKEAQIIEAKQKRIAELSIATSPKKICLKTHWDYVLEEMSWLANDFAQERVWKITAAAQIGARVALACRLRKQEKSSGMEPKKVAHALAKSVMEFWHSVEEGSEVLKLQSARAGALSIQAYALRFLKYNNSNDVHHKAEVPMTPDRESDMGVLDLSWEDNLTEENLFYTVPPGAMETYKNSVELQVSQCERTGGNVQEEEEISAAADFEYQDNEYDEDEGETNAYEMSMGFEGSKASRFGQKKRKHLTHAYCVRSYETSPDLLPMQFPENKVALLAKRPSGSLNVSIPTKRVRTASRRVVSPFNAGMSGCVQLPNKTDASSGDTNSFQDDQGTPHGGSDFPNSLEVESVGGFEKRFQFHSAEVSTKHKKKKKAKHLNATYEPRWHVDSTFQNEQFQRDHLKRSHQLEPNGSSGLLGQAIVKKPKIMWQSQDNSFENIASIGGSVASPVASQMSNMSNPNKVIKLLGGRDRGRKPKILKMPAGQPGSGSPWTLFEDQALVVLAHDLGPNWELVSDVINSTLQFKCIFRKAKECKERHSFLMDRTSGDGADSAEDSGSSQPYPSTLPGIPKGSARQLFQRLQGPMEEETLRSHFEKIIIIGQKQHYNKNQDPKPLQQPHSSHTIAPNNLNGGPVLTPLDLIDATIAGPDMLSVGYQGPHSGGLAIPSQGSVTPMHPASGSSSVLPGSPNMMLGNNFSSSPGALNSSVRDVRYGIPRSASLSTDEQQRIQQFNQMISSRNISQPNISVPGALPGTDRGGRILAGGNGMGLVGSVNRSMPMARPGFQGIASSAMVNSGGMVSPGMAAANMHPGVGSGQGSSMLRPREALHMMRPGQGQDSQRQTMAPDLQMQVSPGKTQGGSHFGGLSSPFPNQAASPPVSSYPLHHQPSHPISPQQPQVLSPHHPHFQGPTNHAPSPQQQAYAIRVAKERQQHRFMQQQPQQQLQQPQFAASSSLMPHVQSQHQFPIPSAVQNSSQVQPQAGSPPVTLSPLTSASSMNPAPQHQLKHQTLAQGVVRNAQTTPTGKQRQRQQQQFSQASRQHPQLRPQPQAQQPAKVAKGVGRGNLMMHQNISVDSSLANGASTNPGNQGSEKGEAATHLTQSQGLFTGSTLNAVQPTRQYVSPQSSIQSLPQQKNYSGQAALSSKHLHQMTDNSSQSHAPTVAPVGHQFVSPLAVAGSNHQPGTTPQKSVNQNQAALQRAVQPNRAISSDQSGKPQARDSDTGQQRTSSSTEMDIMTTLPQATNNANATNAVQVSPASAHQWNASEGPNALNSATNLSSFATTPSNSSEAAAQVGQGLGRRPSPSSFPSIRHDVSAQWQQQPSQLQQPNSPLPQPQQHPQQAQLHQAGNSNLYGRPSENSME
ncbi:Nucleoplasmin ATPase [Handroanthus impetiginosus]|uniref:Nucleoplasmin ATPase n=1 Tax=Handroanthus impetiginosus TaxID=429701 RepID=A0A2G9GSN2_9LAMI|nr:Nucleoplasmin ATPase [Handroanthus impetiginosus]